MAWWDSIIDTVFNFAKSNPALTGAIASGLTGGFQGKYGENNLGNIAGGAALGYGAGKLAESAGLMTPSGVPSAVAPVAQSVGSAGLSVPGAVATPVAQVATAAAPVSNAWGYAADGMGPPLSAMGESIGPFDSAMAGLEKVQGVAKKYQPVFDLGAKGLSALQGMKDSDAQRAYMDKYQRQADEATAATTDAINRTNKAREDVYLDQRANVAQAGLRAQKGIDVRTAADMREIDSAQGLSGAAREALKRKASVAGAKSGAQAFSGADYQARAGVQAPSYAGLSAPTYSANYADDIGKASKATTEGMMGLYEDITGLRKSKANQQVGGLTG